MAYHRVWSSIWTEPWSEDSRFFALYLLTCEHRVTEGLFRLPMGYVTDDLDWDRGRVNVALRELTEAGFVMFDPNARVVLIPAALKRQPPGNRNAAIAAVRAVENLPSTPLFSLFLGLAERHAPLFAERLHERFPNAVANGDANAVSNAVLYSVPNVCGDGDTDPPAPPPAPTPRSPTATQPHEQDSGVGSPDLGLVS